MSLHNSSQRDAVRLTLSGEYASREPAAPGRSDPADDLTDLFLDAPAAPVGDADAPRRGARDILDADELDELLAPLVTPGEGDRRRAAPQGETLRRPAPGSLPVEAAILGHLPVRASIWIRQHARDRSGELDEPVALLTLRDAHATLEVIDGSRPTGEEPEALQAGDLREALDLAADRAALLIVSVEETDEPALIGLASVRRITLLTGADEAAVVACYRSLKTLAARIEPMPAHQRPAIGVAILGAAPDRAEHARGKLASTAASFLSVPVEVRISSQRVSGAPSVPLFHARLDDADPAGEIFAALSGARTPREHAPSRTAPRARLGAFADAAEEPPAPRPAAGARPVEPLRHEPSRPEPAPAAAETSRIAAPRREEPAPAPQPAAAHPEPTPEPQLREPKTLAAPRLDAEALLRALDLRPLGVRCPHAPNVRFAADGAGRLHLVDATGLSGSFPGALAELIVAEGWARANAELLRRAEPLLSDADAETTRHAGVTDARSARPLLDAPVRVHLVVATPAGVTAVPLN